MWGAASSWRVRCSSSVRAVATSVGPMRATTSSCGTSTTEAKGKRYSVLASGCCQSGAWIKVGLRKVQPPVSAMRSPWPLAVSVASPSWASIRDENWCATAGLEKAAIWAWGVVEGTGLDLAQALTEGGGDCATVGGYPDAGGVEAGAASVGSD